MLLVVDVGNTQTHFGVYRDGEDVVAEDWRFATVRESTRDELGAALSNLLGLSGLRFAIGAPHTLRRRRHVDVQHADRVGNGAHHGRHR